MNNILKDYNKNGFVKIENVFDKLFINNIIGEVENLTDVDTYRDSSDKLRRVERVYNKGKYLKELGLVVKQKLKDIFGYNFNIFKDKYNFKPPGGEGFFCHYDGVFYFHDSDNNKKKGWYEYADYFLTVGIAIDSCNEDNATLEISQIHNLPFEKLILNTKNDGTPVLLESVEKKLDFQILNFNIGDIAIFSNLAPHRSKKNNSSVSRRMLFYTYTPEKFGNNYEKYYFDKKNSKNKKNARGEIISHFCSTTKSLTEEI